MINSVKLDKDFNSTFGRFLDNYDSHETYASQLTGMEKTNEKGTGVLDYVSSHGFLGGSNSYHFEAGAYNFLMFIMLKNRILLAETAFQMVQYARKSSVDDRAVSFAVNTVYSGKLRQTLFKKLEEISNLVRGLKGKDEDKDNDSKDSHRKDSNDKKKNKKQEQEASSSEESDEEEEVDGSDNNSDSSEDSD
jgi:hypothetical protein